MNRPARHLIPLAALLAAGCIENPGVDPGLGRPSPEKAMVEARFRQGNFLQLRLTRDSGRISLIAANTGLATIDSAAFLLRISGSHKGFTPHIFHDPHPNLEYYGKAAGLGPGESADFGVIDTLLPFRMSEGVILAWVIRAAEDGRRTGNAFGGVFTGTHRGVDTGGKVVAGPLRGLVTADGAFQFSIYRADSEWPLGELSGSVTDSGTMAAAFSLDYQNPGRAGRLFPREEGFGGSFTFANPGTGMGKRWIDSLAVEYQAYSPR